MSTRASSTGWIQYGDLSGSEIAGFDTLAPGGIVLPFKNGSGGTLLLGDSVFISADRSVSKSILPADHTRRVGIVVGGQQTGFECNNNLGEYGSRVAANATEVVLVCIEGVSYVICDAAIAAGVPIAPSTTVAGRVRPATLPVVAAGAVAVTSSAANGAGTVSGDGFSRIHGTMLEASTGAGQVKLALILSA